MSCEHVAIVIGTVVGVGFICYAGCKECKKEDNIYEKCCAKCCCIKDEGEDFCCCENIEYCCKNIGDCCKRQTAIVEQEPITNQPQQQVTSFITQGTVSPAYGELPDYSVVSFEKPADLEFYVIPPPPDYYDELEYYNSN